MRVSLGLVVTAVVVFGAACQSNNLVSSSRLPAPQRLSYQLEPSGDPTQPVGILLAWDDVPASGVAGYRVYSRGSTADAYGLRGVTTSNTFHDNGVPRCFGVSAVDTLGYESLWSPIWSDTPRPDARNVLVWAYDVQPLQSGFRFWDDLNGNGYGDAGELGLVQDGNRTDIDFRIERDVNDTLWIVPVFSGTSVLSYGPTAALTDIDLAPTSGYSRQRAKMLPGYGYVFEIVEGQEVRYGALRVTHAGTQYAIFDWSFQTDRGNLELAPRAGLATAPAVTGGRVAASR